MLFCVYYHIDSIIIDDVDILVFCYIIRDVIFDIDINEGEEMCGNIVTRRRARASIAAHTRAASSISGIASSFALHKRVGA